MHPRIVIPDEPKLDEIAGCGTPGDTRQHAPITPTSSPSRRRTAVPHIHGRPLS